MQSSKLSSPVTYHTAFWLHGTETISCNSLMPREVTDVFCFWHHKSTSEPLWKHSFTLLGKIWSKYLLLFFFIFPYLKENAATSKWMLRYLTSKIMGNDVTYDIVFLHLFWYVSSKRHNLSKSNFFYHFAPL